MKHVCSRPYANPGMVYLCVTGVGFMMRTIGNKQVPTVEITEADGMIELKTVTTFKTTTIKFKLGETFEEETADGRKVQVSPKLSYQR